MKEVTPHMLLAHQKMLQTSNITIPHTKVSMKRLTIPAGATSFTADNLYKGKPPTRIVLGMVLDDAATGTYWSNPFNFQHFNLNYIALQANSEYIPRIPYTPDFAKKDYLNPYMGVMSALNYDVGPYTWDLGPHDWADGYNLWVFKIAPSTSGIVRSTPVTGTLRLDMKFSIAPANPIALIVMAEEAATLEIDKFNNVFI